jgi:hypothetical protein
VVKPEVDPKLLAADLQRILAADKGEPDAQLQQKIADMLDEPTFDLALLGLCGERKKVEIVGNP